MKMNSLLVDSEPTDSGQTDFRETSSGETVSGTEQEGSTPGQNRRRPVPATMKAITQDRYGDASEVLSESEVAVPEPGPREVLLEVHAGGVDQGTWHLVAGMPLVVRLGFGFRRPKNPVPGLDVSGVVVALGSEVADLEVGDEVFGIARGSFAEFAVADAAKIVRRPDALGSIEAAGLAVSGVTALQAVRDSVGVKPGERVLVIGASGGVGSFAVQIAKSLGAEVTGVCSAAKADLVRSLGADHVIDYRSEALDATGGGFDAIIDTGGANKLRVLRGVLAERGRLVIVGSETGGRFIGGVGRAVRGAILSMFTKQTIRMLMSSEDGDDMAELARLVEAGAVRVALDQARPRNQAAATISDLRAGRVRGKMVLTA